MTKAPSPAQNLALTPEVRRLAPHCLARRAVIQPGMCGCGSLFLGQVGDWTWETVSALCDLNVFRARSAEGEPTYLAFYYFHVQASAGFHPGSLGFGDEVEVVSSLFDFGKESILTLHRIRPLASGPWRPRVPDPGACYGPPEPATIYVENFNRWICRGQPESNRGLVSSSPAGFRHTHLPELPEALSPRRVFHGARRRGTFRLPLAAGEEPFLEKFRFLYPIDVTRDLNGVGLVYFAAFFNIIDRGILEAWKALGRDEISFLRRVVLDLKVCFLGNTDIGAVLELVVTAWTVDGDPGREVFDVTLVEQGRDQPLAIATVDLLREPRHEVL